jgi:hypothetical protein
MRANEFLRETDTEAHADFRMPGSEQPVKITIPVTVNIPDSVGDTINVSGEKGKRLNTTIAQPATDEMPSEPIWIPPGQQTLELEKQQGGKTSPVINQIVKSDNGPDSDPTDGVFANLSDDNEEPVQSIYYGRTQQK